MDAQVDAAPLKAPPKPMTPPLPSVGLETVFVVEVEDARDAAPLTREGGDGAR